MDGCDLLNGLVLGVVASTIVSYFTYLIINRKSKKDLRTKFSKAAGNYLGYGFEPHDLKDPSKGYKWILNEKSISKASISYLDSNRLEITLEHNNLKWQGEIFMDSETSGTVAWRYLNLTPEKGKEQHQFGLKRIVIRDDHEQQKMFVYLIGEIDEGYKKEVLVRSLDS